jgi:hypothetical protein
MPVSDLNSAAGEKLLYGSGNLEAFAEEMERVSHALPLDKPCPSRACRGTDRGIGTSPRRIRADPESVERDLARLVLTLIELLRQLMERQALRRVEAGSLCDDEIERLGQTFMKLETRMEELKVIFGLSDEDLNLNLGPLGDLL